MTASMAAYVTNDTLMKLSAGNVTLFQAIFLRGVAAVCVISVIAILQKNIKAKLPHPELKFLGLRILGEIGSTFCFLNAIFNMPLANAISILQSLPLAVTLGATIFLREPVGWRRWIAIIIGFFGVMIVIRPGSDGFTVFSLFALAAVGFIVLRDLATKKISSQIPSILVALISTTTITIAGGILIPTVGWNALHVDDLYLLGGAAIFLAFGSLFNVMTMRVGDVSFIAPFRYTHLLWAILFGGVFFNHYPDFATLIGSAIVVLTGIYSFHREFLQQR